MCYECSEYQEEVKRHHWDFKRIRLALNDFEWGVVDAKETMRRIRSVVG